MRYLLIVLLLVGCKQPPIEPEKKAPVKSGDEILNDIKRGERLGKGVC